MPGRPPKPTALKLVQGNPGKRKINREEPQFAGEPDCPSWLTDEAQDEWRRIVGQLSALNMLRSVDMAALASYCVSYARWEQAERTVTEEGQTVQEPVVNKSGDVVGHKVKRHPATLIARDAQAAMHKAASLFGFDPSSRTRIHIGEPATKDAFEEFLKVS